MQILKSDARYLPQSPSVTAPSRREPSYLSSSLHHKLKSVPQSGTPQLFTIHYSLFIFTKAECFLNIFDIMGPIMVGPAPAAKAAGDPVI